MSPGYMQGAWQLKTLKGPVDLYTRQIKDIIRNKKTGQEYFRGKRKLFFKPEEFPPLVEDSEDYEFLYLKDSNTTGMSTEDFARELFINQTLKK